MVRVLLVMMLLSSPIMAAEIVLDDTTEMRDTYGSNQSTACDGNDCRWYNFGRSASLVVGHNGSTNEFRGMIGFVLSSLPSTITSAIYSFLVSPSVYGSIDEAKPLPLSFYRIDPTPGVPTEGEGTPGIPGYFDVEVPAVTWRHFNYDSPVGGGSADSTLWTTGGGPPGYYCGGNDVITDNVDSVLIDTAGWYTMDLTADIQDAIDEAEPEVWFLLVQSANLSSLTIPVGSTGVYIKGIVPIEYWQAWPDSSPFLTVTYPDAGRRRNVLLRTQ